MVNGLSILYGMGVIVLLLAIVFWIWMIVDCIKRKFKNKNEKVIWGLVIILTGIIGAFIYYCIIKAKVEEKSEIFGSSGFTIGVIGIVFSGWIGLILSFFGLIFSIAQQKRHKIGFGKAGVIVNLVGIVLSILIIVLYSKFIAPLLGQVGQ